MRIGLVVPDMDPAHGRGGGIASYGRSLGRGLLDEGHEVHIFTRPAAKRGAHLFPAGVAVHFIDEFANPSPEIREIFASCGDNLAWSYALGDYLIRGAGSLSLDVLEGPDFVAPLFFLQLRKLLDPRSFPAPVVIRLHSFAEKPAGYGRAEPFARPAYVMDHAELFSAGAAQGLVATNRFTRGLVCRSLGIRESSVPCAALPVDLPAARPLKARRESWRLVFAGRLEHRKGPDLLIRAALPLLERYPLLDIRLIGADRSTGKDGSMLARLRGSVPPAHRERFRFVGPLTLPELRRELRSAAAAVIPSRFDNSPYVGLEAILAGCPLIASGAAGYSDILVHRRSGLICDPDVESLSAAVGLFLGMSPEERAAMAAAALSRARRLCDPALIARGQVDFYRGVIARNERTRLPSFFPFRDRRPRSRGARPQAACASRPSTVSVIEGCRTAASKNRAARAAAGDYLVFAADGAAPSPGYLRRAARALDSNPELGFVSPWRRGLAPLVFEFPAALLEPLADPTAMVRRRAFEDAGGFAAGRDLWVSICERGWGGATLADSIELDSSATGDDGEAAPLGRPRLMRRFQEEASRMRAAGFPREKAAPFDVERARLALGLWKDSVRRDYD
ncbi:MAG: glycosyltransferase [Elusimicrobiota bacterium]